MSDIERDLIAFIVETFLFGNHDEAPDPDVSFMETGLVDSTGILELVAFLESRWEIAVNDEDLIPENLDSVRNIKEFVERKRG